MAMSGCNSGPTVLPSVGIFGGTFNPVHIGHLRTAVELREALSLDEMRFMPCAVPPHRQPPEQLVAGLTADHRLAMLHAAIAGEPGLAVDDTELRRARRNAAQKTEQPSYTIDTVVELRRELGANVSICLCIGMDSLVNLASWRRWQELLDYMHIVVAARPGWSVPQNCPVADMIARCEAPAAHHLLQRPAGLVRLAEMTLLPVSSTEIRDALQGGRSVRYLLPEPVISYIGNNNLYQRP